MTFSRNKDVALLFLRLVFGAAMIYGHGWPKLLRLLGDDPIQFADPFGLGPEISLGLATFAEVVCAALLIVGLFTRWATIPLIITMLVAAFYANWGEPFGRWEKAFLFLTAYISLYLSGPGWYSLDEQWRNRV